MPPYPRLPRAACMPRSMRRRSASERVGVSDCCAAQASTSLIVSAGKRKDTCGS